MMIVSEAVVVADNILLDFFKVIEALKEAILEDSVELVFDACQHSVLLVDVKAKRVERCLPIKLVQVEEFEIVQDLAHTRLHLCLVQEVFFSQVLVLLGDLDVARFKPWVASLESIIEEIS